MGRNGNQQVQRYTPPSRLDSIEASTRLDYLQLDFSVSHSTLQMRMRLAEAHKEERTSTRSAAREPDCRFENEVKLRFADARAYSSMKETIYRVSLVRRTHTA